MRAAMVKMLWTQSHRDSRGSASALHFIQVLQIYLNMCLCAIFVKSFGNSNSDRLTLTFLWQLPHDQSAVPHHQVSVQHKSKGGTDMSLHLHVQKVSHHTAHFCHLSYSTLAWSSKTRKKGKDDGKEASLHRFLSSPASLPTQTYEAIKQS